MLVVSSSFATTYYWTGSHWSLTSGGPADGTAPSATSYGDDFVIEAAGYEVTSGTSVAVRDFTVNDGGFTLIYFQISGNINIGGKFETISTSGVNGAACQIKAGGYLELSSNLIPSKVPRPVIYSDVTSKMSVFKLDVSPAGLSTIYPGSGVLELKQPDYVYDFGNENMIIDNTRRIDLLATGITIKANSLLLNTNVNISPTAQNSIFDIFGDITISSGYSLGLSTNGISLLSSTGRIIVQAGAKIVTNNNTGSINKLTLEGSPTAQGIIVGAGFTCNDVTMSVVPDWSRSDVTWGDYAWREFGTPFAKSIYGSDVTWGGSNEANINGNDGADVDPGNGSGSDSYINYWDSTAQLWKVPSTSGSGSGTGPYTGTVNLNSGYEVWYEGNASNTITITGGSLSTSHNNGYTVSADVADDDYSLIPNPFACYLDLDVAFDDLFVSGNISILTYGNGGYSYKTWDRRGRGSFGSSGMGKKSIPPFQAFWVSSELFDGDGISTDAQIDEADGSSLSKKNNLYIPPYVDLSLLNVDGNLQEFMSLSFVDDPAYLIDDFNAINMNGLGNMATMYIPNTSGNRIYEGHDILEIEGGIAFTSDIEMIGNISGTYSISMSDMTIDPSYNVYLFDRLSDAPFTGWKLNDNPYSFTHNSANDANRFEIQITTETLGELEKIEASSIKLINKGNAIEFVMPSTSGIESVQFVSLNGQVVKTVQAYKGQTEFDVTGFNSGVYIAQLKLESGNVASYKFVK